LQTAPRTTTGALAPTEPSEAAELFCPTCGYSLHALAGNQCPECGGEFNRQDLRESTLPWVHRAKVGRIRAFCQTVHLVTFRPKKFAVELTRPAHFSDAVLFRRLAILCALIPVGFGLTIELRQAFLRGGIDIPSNLLLYAQGHETLLAMLGWVLMWICLALLLFGMTGVITYFFHPRELTILRQNRAIALGYYTCAPLAYTLVAMLCPIVAHRAMPALARLFGDVSALNWISLLSWLPAVLQVTLVILEPNIVLAFVTPSPASRVKLAIAQLITWPCIAALCLVAIPVACITLTLMAISLFN
jgi:hypothetical protein